MFDIALILKIVFLLNPLMSVPLLVYAHEKGMNSKEIALQAVLLAAVVAVVFLIVGPFLFDVFGISTASFRIAGGLVIVLLGINMARGESKSRQVDKAQALISVIATPILTGPATLSFLVITVRDLGTSAIPMIVFNLFWAFVIVGLVLYFFARLIPNVNLTYVEFVSRLLGLFLLAVGIEMIAKGAKVLFNI